VHLCQQSQPVFKSWHRAFLASHDLHSSFDCGHLSSLSIK
jgi:hypothetical protein